MNYLLSLRERNTGGAVVPGRLENGPGLGTADELALERALTIIVHGYNVSGDKGRGALLRFAKLIAAADSTGIIAVLWPGDHWSGALSYSWEGRDADDSAAALVRFLGDHVQSSVPISFVAHSLGNRVALEAVERLVEQGYETRQLCLLAGAVDTFCLASPQDYLEGVSASGRAAVLWSKQDKVLKYAYPAGDLLQAFLFFRDDTKGFALGYCGPKPHPQSGMPVPANVIDVRIPDVRKADHGDYLPSAEPNVPTNSEQKSTATFVKAVLADDPQPVYI